MCGIYGFTQSRYESKASGELLRQMGKLLEHRGPDGDGSFIDDEVALGHRRLKIIDLEGGSQPMQDWQQRYVVTFNGEIYNFQELRAQFEKRGFRFQTRSDTETILAAYHFYGEACVECFQGMFAFGLWDKQSKKLLLARDRLGKKPLYYFRLGKRFVFSSEMKAILALPDVPREIDFEALNQYLTFGYIPAPLTIFKHIRKLKPAQTLILENGELKTKTYWNLPQPESATQHSEQEYVEQLDGLLQEAVRSRLISDVPLGAFLSGGLDSSTIVSTMTRVSNQPVRAFTIDFTVDGFSEVDEAKKFVKHLGVVHTVRQIFPDAVRLLPKLVWHFDEPFGDSSAVPTYYVSEMARQNVTVILSGDGGDELFAGYRSYLLRDEYMMIRRLPLALRKMLFAPIAQALPFQAPARNFLKFAAYAQMDDGPQALGLYPYIKDDVMSGVVRRELKSFDASMQRREIFAELEKMDKLTKLQHVDTKIYLPEDILMKVDRMSMANSLETRAPLLDYRLVEFAAKLPANLKMREGTTKYLLKKLMQKYFPKNMISNKKQGFAIPINAWCQNQLSSFIHEILLDSRCYNRGYFNGRAVEKMLHHHSTGQRDYSEWIWLLLNLELWFQTFMDQDTRRV